MNTETQPETKSSNASLVERLFAVGAHFGFTRSRRHPTVAPYIYANKQGTDIIDLEKTASSLESAKQLLEDAGKQGKTILFVATKEEIKNIVEASAQKVNAAYVVNRWVGGMLTNFSEIKKRVQRLNTLVSQGESGELERKYTKKERVLIGRELDKLMHNFAGIKDMDKLPGLMVVVDPRHDAIAIAEANQLNIPVVGITSSDANLDVITQPVVANDALQTSVTCILDELTDAYEAGKAAYTEPKKEDTRRKA